MGLFTKTPEEKEEKLLQKGTFSHASSPIRARASTRRPRISRSPRSHDADGAEAKKEEAQIHQTLKDLERAHKAEHKATKAERDAVEVRRAPPPHDSCAH